MLYHARQPHSGINGDRPTPRVDSEGRKPWRAFCGGNPRQLVREALVGEAPASEREGCVRLAARTPGDVAQLGERGICNPEAAGSIPVISTAPVARGPRYRGQCRLARERLLVLVARHASSAAWSVCGSRWCNSTRATDLDLPRPPG